MLGRSVGITALGVLGASALIIPPGIAPSSNTDAPDLLISPINPKKSVITLPCAECAFPMSSDNAEAEEIEEDIVWIQGGANSLALVFSVSDDGKDLRLNGKPLFPLSLEHLLESYGVKQVASQATLSAIESGDASFAHLDVTRYSVKEGMTQSLSPDGDMVIPITFQIMAVEGMSMTLDAVEITLFQTGSGELLIMGTEVLPTESTYLPQGIKFSPDMESEVDDQPPPPPFDGPEDMAFPPPPPFHGPPHHFKQNKECNMLPAPLCKLKAMLEDKIDDAMRPGPHFRGGCHGPKGAHGRKMPGHIKGPHFRPFGDDGRPNHHHGRPHHSRPHGHHHGHHGHFFKHHILHAFAKGLVAVLIPVMAGITVGLTVSLMGLVVGRLIAFFWIKLARGGRRGSASAVAIEEVVVVEDEDKAMLAEMEAPPVYEDAPAYVDVVDEKEVQ